MKLTVILNYKSENNRILAQKMIDYLRTQPVELFLPEGRPGFSPEEYKDYHFNSVDVALVLGGDGTILAAARQITDDNLAILGVNMGKVGFLTEVEEQNLIPALDGLILEKYTIEERTTLEATVIRDNSIFVQMIALNDFAINNSLYLRTLDLSLDLKNEHITDYRADGIVFSTPTGSTAYSFSAGGPIVMPSLDLFLITPICSHSIFSRPLVIDGNETVSITINSPSDCAALVADGQLRYNLKKNDLVTIKTSSKKVRLIRLSNFNFFTRVRRKIYKQK